MCALDVARLYEPWMRMAIAEAEAAQGLTHPNPAVGAIVVHQGQVVALGRTQPPGGLHAEKQALAAWRETGAPLDATTTLYVTLEPCCTHGRTPPCTDTILASGIRRVVVGATDPNPAHAGRAYPLLRAAGIEVIEGILAKECADLNPIFNHWITTGHPLIAAKVAVTLDGHPATRTGESRWITGEMAREDVHRWRHYFPSLGTGAGSVLFDAPHLNIRRAGAPYQWRPRFIFDRALRTLGQGWREQPVYADAGAAQTVTVIPAYHRATLERWSGGFEASALLTEQVRQLCALGRTFWLVEGEGPVFWANFRPALLAADIIGLYLEPGPGLAADLWRHQAVDYLYLYQAPKLLLDPQAPTPFAGQPTLRLTDALTLRETRVAMVGDDVLVRGWVNWPGA